MSEETKKGFETTEVSDATSVTSTKTVVNNEPTVINEEAMVPSKFKKIVEEIESLSVLDLNELVKVFENKFGVSASAVAVAGPAVGAPAEEVKDTMNVELTDGGATKIAIIKIVKEVLGLGLKEAKDLVDAAPSMLKTDMKKEEAEGLKKKIEEAGGKVTLK